MNGGSDAGTSLDPAAGDRPQPGVRGDGVTPAAQAPPLDSRFPARRPGHPPPARPRRWAGRLRPRRRAGAQDLLDLLGVAGPGEPGRVRVIRTAPCDHPPAAATDGTDPVRVLPGLGGHPAPDVGPDEGPAAQRAPLTPGPRPVLSRRDGRPAVPAPGSVLALAGHAGPPRSAAGPAGLGPGPRRTPSAACASLRGAARWPFRRRRPAAGSSRRSCPRGCLRRARRSRGGYGRTSTARHTRASPASAPPRYG